MLISIVVLFSLPLHAASIEQPLPDAAQEATAREVFHALKCVVCEGQSLAESDAALAAQMRAHVRTLAGEGKTQAEILGYFRERYGDTILLSPPVEPTTYLLWAMPLILLLAGGTLVWRLTKPRDSHD